MRDENYIEGSSYQFRSSLDRRFWHTSGGWPDAIMFGVVDDYGSIVRTNARPYS
jgi:hypothetical protein